MIIIDIGKSIVSSFILRRKKINDALDKVERIQDRAEGIESFGYTVARHETQIKMIMSFMGIFDRRKKNKSVKKNRRQNDSKKT